jgi:hypothetical protein
MNSQRTKAALIRDPNVPVGTPAPLHVECECGRKVPVECGANLCECGISYDSRGWITRPEALA